MKRFAFKYAIVQFMPYLETAEFANVGIILMIPEKNIFSYKLETKKTARLTHFFKHLESQIYLKAAHSFSKELEYLKQAVAGGEVKADKAFDMIVRPLETMLRFSEPRVAMSKDAESLADTLFGRFVLHDFAKRETNETLLQKRLAHLVAEFELEEKFKRNKQLGNGIFGVNFAFLQQRASDWTRVIQPLSFEEKSSIKIIEHANNWCSKFRTLDELGMKPKDVLIPVQAESFGTREQNEAWKFSKKHLMKYGDLVSAKDELPIEKFVVA